MVNKSANTLALGSGENLDAQARGALDRRRFVQAATVGVATTIQSLTGCHSKQSTVAVKEPAIDLQKEALKTKTLDHVNAGIHWAPITKVMAENPEFCVDGRKTEAGVCEPGGSTGQRMTEFAAIEKASGKKIVRTADEMLAKQVELKKAPIYLHTDHHAIHRIAEALEISEKKVRDYLRHAPEDENLQEKLLELLADPRVGIGCLHMRKEVENTGDLTYDGIQSERVQEFLKAMQKRKWNEDEKVIIEELEGEHEEKGMIVMKANSELTPESFVPLIRPNVNGQQYFVLHPDVQELQDIEFADLGPIITGITEFSRQKYINVVGELREKHLETSAKILLKNKPVITVNYDPKRRQILEIDSQ